MKKLWLGLFIVLFVVALAGQMFVYKSLGIYNLRFTTECLKDGELFQTISSSDIGNAYCSNCGKDIEDDLMIARSSY